MCMLKVGSPSNDCLWVHCLAWCVVPPPPLQCLLFYQRCVCLQARKGDRCGHCVSGKEPQGADRGAGDSSPPCPSCHLLLWKGVIKAQYQLPPSSTHSQHTPCKLTLFQYQTLASVYWLHTCRFHEVAITLGHPDYLAHFELWFCSEKTDPCWSHVVFLVVFCFFVVVFLMWQLLTHFFPVTIFGFNYYKNKKIKIKQLLGHISFLHCRFYLVSTSTPFSMTLIAFVSLYVQAPNTLPARLYHVLV